MSLIKLDKQRVVDTAHEMRRAKRGATFEPLDKQLMIRIPGQDLEQIEAARQAVREHDAKIQAQINKLADGCIDDLGPLVKFVKAHDLDKPGQYDIDLGGSK